MDSGSAEGSSPLPQTRPRGEGAALAMPEEDTEQLRREIAELRRENAQLRASQAARREEVPNVAQRLEQRSSIRRPLRTRLDIHKFTRSLLRRPANAGSGGPAETAAGSGAATGSSMQLVPLAAQAAGADTAGSSAALPLTAAGASALVPSEKNTQSATAAELVDASQAQPQQPSSANEEPLWPTSPEVQKLLEQASGEVTYGPRDEAAATFLKAFQLHLRDFDRPYLAFSAAIPKFLSSLRANLPPPAADAAVVHRPADSANELCITLLRHVVGEATFGDRPATRQGEMQRQQYVREMSAQAGLSLDLARLAYLREQKPRNDAKHASMEDSLPLPAAMETGEPPLQNSEEANPSLAARLGLSDRATEQPAMSQALVPFGAPPAARSRSRSRERRHEPADVNRREEISSALQRAGRYLGAVHVEMTELHSEVRTQRFVKRVANSGETEPTSTETPACCESTLVASADGPIPIMGATEQCEAKEEPRTATEVVLRPSAVSSFPSLTPESCFHPTAAPMVPDAIQEFGMEDEDRLTTPTFGQFVDLQLLPLYITGIPFRKLKNLVEQNCGAPLDSDDEEKAWGTLGRSAPPQPQPKRRGKSRAQRESSRRKHMPVATPLRKERLFMSAELSTKRVSGAALRASELKPEAAGDGAGIWKRVLESGDAAGRRAAVREQMSNSVVEKRRKKDTAPTDMEAPRTRPARDKRTVSAPITPGNVARPSGGHGATPRTPLPAAFSRTPGSYRLSHTATASPISMRRPGASLPVPTPPRWAEMDTPARDRGTSAPAR